MSQTILIEPDEGLKKIFTLNLQTYALTDIVDRTSAKDTIELLAILPTISLIICKNEVDGEKTAIKIANYLKENELEIPMIILGECKELTAEHLTLKYPISWEILVKHAADILGVSQELLEQQKAPAFVPIDSYYFYDIKHTPCDVYIRIKRENNEFHFVKRLHNQDRFTIDDIKKYEAQGLKKFYVPKDYQQYFVTFVTNSIIQELEKNDLTLKERLTTNANAYDIVRDQIDIAGLDKASTELADSCIQSMVKSINSAPKLADLLKELLSNKISYAYQHAHLVAVIGDFILSKQTWYKPQHLDIFTFVAFFSDITLKTSEEIQINSTRELKESSLTDAQKQNVMSHAQSASEIVLDHPSQTEDMITIIREHHGASDGIGFEDTSGEDLHPISRVFMVSDAFVKIMLNPEGPKNKKDILSILYAQYTNEKFQKIIKVLEQKID
jgi:HD-GYP domain-containing protein (c-di-GMP phosphodiesterase class II)